MKSVSIDRIKEILSKFNKNRILVFGDLMIDEFIYTKVNRISPEAPVPVAEVENKEYKLGGASNVANNIVKMGGKCFLSGVVGKDGFGRLFREECDQLDIDSSMVTVDSSRPTTVKTRILASNQQIARIDNEKRHYIHSEVSENILDHLKENIDHFDAVIFSDYAKGVMEKSLVRKIIELCKENNKITAVDPKINDIELIRDIDLVKPNLKETEILSGKIIDSEEKLFEIGDELLSKLNSKALMVTRGAEGITIFRKESDFTVPTVAKKVYDVTGAGDTTIATFIMAYLAGANLKESTVIANIAAGIVVGEVGTATADIDSILEYAKEILEEL